MNHLASRAFWKSFDGLPKEVQELARKQFRLLMENPSHPSLHLKKVGRFWSVRIGAHYRALATEVDGDMRWHWIGSHSEYDNRTE
jgi:mRNA-degrading endonuclease RelE of RelBE toxin-antitoxin system